MTEGTPHPDYVTWRKAPRYKGKKHFRAWNSWRAMKERCGSPNYLGYANYGGRGIDIDPRWNDFDMFFYDMGECPAGMTLDRIDNDKNYFKDNCHWATRSEQTFNSRKRSDNATGIRGVYHENSKAEIWIANYFENGVRTTLYRGPDFLLACCARKSWEARSGNQI